MEVGKAGSSPRTVTSKRRIEYRTSAWRCHEFEVWSGGGALVCRAAVLRMERSLLVWVGAREPRLLDAALGVPHAGGALATALLGAGAAPGLARRLAAARACPALVCCGQAFDRFTAPLVERGLAAEVAAELRAHPDH